MKQILLLSDDKNELDKLLYKLPGNIETTTNYKDVTKKYDKIIVLFNNTDYKSFKINMKNAFEIRMKQLTDGNILFIGTKSDQPNADINEELKRFCLHYSMTHFNISTYFSHNINKVIKFITSD